VVGYNPRKWNHVPYKCVNCGEMVGENSLERNAISAFKEAVADLMKAETLFEVRLEFNGERE